VARIDGIAMCPEIMAEGDAALTVEEIQHGHHPQTRWLQFQALLALRRVDGDDLGAVLPTQVATRQLETYPVHARDTAGKDQGHLGGHTSTAADSVIGMGEQIVPHLDQGHDLKNDLRVRRDEEFPLQGADQIVVERKDRIVPLPHRPSRHHVLAAQAARQSLVATEHDIVDKRESRRRPPIMDQLQRVAVRDIAVVEGPWNHHGHDQLGLRQVLPTRPELGEPWS
jgi:hypothetical protein